MMLYSAAGLCSLDKESSEDTIPTIRANSQSDQPASHVLPAATESNPLHGVKIPCYGDQLSHVRMAAAKDLRSGCNLAKQRLDDVYPFHIVDWHMKRSLRNMY